jgi:hypothetical protein
MKRYNLPLVLRPLPLLALLGGCGQSNPGGVWDAASMTWEAAPPRVIIGGDASSDADPGSLPGSMPRSFDKMCTGVNQPWCCYDGYNLPGYPLCGWKALALGTSVVIDWAFAGHQKVTLPSPLLLTSTTPERFTSTEDCNQLPVGFVLEGKGLIEEPLTSSNSYFYIRKDGTWAPAGAVSASESPDLILAKNSDPATRPDGGAGSLPPPKAHLDGDTCGSEANASANIVVFSRVRFRIGDIEYDLDFNRPPLTGTRGYYVRIERTY